MSSSVEGLVRRLRQSARQTEWRAGRVSVPGVPHLSLGSLVRLTAQHAKQDMLAAFAGNLTYNAFLAIFPFLLFLVSLLKLVHATGLITKLVDLMGHSLPTPAEKAVRQQILREVMSRLTSSPLLSVFLALGSLWAVSAVVRAAMAALNRMYGVEESRPLWVRMLLSIVLSLAAALLFLAALALIVFGPTAGTAAGRLSGSASLGWWVSAVVRWPVLIGLAFLAFALLYYYAPNLEQRFRFASAGAFVATLAWLAFSLLFSLVLNHFAQNLITPLYGWFTGLIVLLMYMYWSSVIVLVGAEINRVIDAHSETRAPKQ